MADKKTKKDSDWKKRVQLGAALAIPTATGVAVTGGKRMGDFFSAEAPEGNIRKGIKEFAKNPAFRKQVWPKMKGAAKSGALTGLVASGIYGLTNEAYLRARPKHNDK